MKSEAIKQLLLTTY